MAPQELERLRREARILHFNGDCKPWRYLCDHPRKGEYRRYLRLTEWRDFVPPDRTGVNAFRKLLAAVLPEAIKRLLRNAYGRLGIASALGSSALPLLMTE